MWTSINFLILLLRKRRSELEGEVFEILLTFTDFLAFKELLLDYRAVSIKKKDDLTKILFQAK